MGVLAQYWLRWKKLKLPWRKRFFVGEDLSGNTFWEFKDALNHSRLRRIVKYPRKTYHSDVHVSPLWHQWLRYTRNEPPTLQEQSADLLRQSQLKHNAMLADARWAAKATYIESPKAEGQAQAAQESTSGGTNEAPTSGKPASKEDPWAKLNETAKNPGSTWQPEPWNPGSTKK